MALEQDEIFGQKLTAYSILYTNFMTNLLARTDGDANFQGQYVFWGDDNSCSLCTLQNAQLRSLENASVSGLTFRSNRPFVLGSKVNLTIDIQGLLANKIPSWACETIAINGIVVECEKFFSENGLSRYRISIMYENFDNSDNKFLSVLIHPQICEKNKNTSLYSHS